MTKEEIKNKLKKAGYSVADDCSVITVYIGRDESIKNTVKKLKELFEKWNYDSSFSVKQRKSDDGKIVDRDAEDSDYSDEDVFSDMKGVSDEEDASYDEVMSDAQDTSYDEEMSDVQDASADPKSGKRAKTKKTEAIDKKGAKQALYEDPEEDTEDTGLLDDDDDDTLSGIEIDEEDMDMLLNEESIEFSLEDFGLGF